MLTAILKNLACGQFQISGVAIQTGSENYCLKNFGKRLLKTDLQSILYTTCSFLKIFHNIEKTDFFFRVALLVKRYKNHPMTQLLHDGNSNRTNQVLSSEKQKHESMKKLVLYTYLKMSHRSHKYVLL